MPEDQEPLELAHTPKPSERTPVPPLSGPPLEPTPTEIATPAEESPEQTEQQKVAAIFDKVREVNAQLGGKLAAEVRFESGRSTLFFARTFRQMQDRGPMLVYGVDLVAGPVYVSGDLSKRLLGGRRDAIDLEQVSSVTEDDVRN